MSEPDNFHMDNEEFRRQGHAVVDWIADYYDRIESLPVLAQVTPGQIRDALWVTGTSVDDTRSGGTQTDMRRINVDQAVLGSAPGTYVIGMVVAL